MADSETLEQLQNIVRLREKELQEKDAKFSKFKLQTKAKLASLNKDLEEARANKSGPGVAALTTNEPLDDSSGDSRESSAEISSANDSPNNNTSNNTKVVVLRQKLEGKELEVKQLTRKLEEKEGLVQGSQLKYGHNSKKKTLSTDSDLSYTFFINTPFFEQSLRRAYFFVIYRLKCA